MTPTRLVLRTGAATALLGTLVASACTLAGPTSVTPADAAAGAAFCAQEVNRRRAAAGLAELAVSPELEAFASESARIDSAAGRPHQHFIETGGGGVATAETELLMWRADVETVIRQGLDQMWSEGEAGEHYRILAGPYRSVGCGVFADAGGVTVAQDFR